MNRMYSFFIVYYLVANYNWSWAGNFKRDNFAGENSDRMNIIYAPWRSSYKPVKSDKEQSCPFCTKFIEQHDTDNLIVKRLKTCVIMLNLYPYAEGHILIMPYKHTPHLHDLEPQERSELMETVSYTVQLLEEFLGCDGINVGINKGKAAGGSVQSHLHIHILPRFVGDTNFLITDNTKVITRDVKKFYSDFKEYMKQKTLSQEE